MKKIRENELPNARLYCGKVKRLAIAMYNNGYTYEDALKFISSAEGILDNDNQKKAIWFKDNLPKLENNEYYKKICEDCACCLGGKRLETARKIFIEENTLEERIERLLKTPLIVGFGGTRTSEKEFEIFFFPKLEYYRCSCLKFEKGKQVIDMPKGYCYCCGGHLKHHIEKALGVKVNVEIITSSLLTKGNEGCKFEIKILD